MYTTAISVFALFLLMFGIPQLFKQFLISGMRRICRQRGVIVLTYDDGPGASLTPELMSLLREANARAMFFPTVKSASQQPSLLSNVATAGHAVGCHGRAHLHAWKATPWRAVADLTGGLDGLKPWLSINAWFRPPYGKISLPMWLAARHRRAQVAFWTVDSGDTWRELPSVDRIIAQVERDGGAVVLMHDFDRMGSDADRRGEHVIAVTRGLINLARRRGWAVCTLDELYNANKDKDRQLAVA